MLGRRFSEIEAKNWNIIDEIISDRESLLSEAKKIALELSKKNPINLMSALLGCTIE